MLFRVRIFFPQSLLCPVLPQGLSASSPSFSPGFLRGSPLPLSSGLASSVGFHPRRPLAEAAIYLRISSKVEIFPTWSYNSKNDEVRPLDYSSAQLDAAPLFISGPFSRSFASAPTIGHLSQSFPQLLLVSEWLSVAFDCLFGFRCRLPPLIFILLDHPNRIWRRDASESSTRVLQS